MDKLRLLVVYFQKRIANDEVVYVYSTRKSYKGTAEVSGQKQNFSISYWDGNAKPQKGGGSVTMWLNDDDGEPLTREQALAFKQVYGSEAYLVVDEDDSFTLQSFEQVQQLKDYEERIVQPSIFAQ